MTWAHVTLVVTMIMGTRGDTGGHHPHGHQELHHEHDLQAAEDQPVLYYANPEDPSQVFSQQGNRDASDDDVRLMRYTLFPSLFPIISCNVMVLKGILCYRK